MKIENFTDDYFDVFISTRIPWTVLLDAFKTRPSGWPLADMR